MKLCVYAIATGGYVKYVPLFIYSGIYYYKDIHFKVFVDSAEYFEEMNNILDNSKLNKYAEIIVLPGFDKWKGWYSTIHRGLMEYKYLKEYDYCIIMDVDVIFTSVTFDDNCINTLIKFMAKFDIPYINKIRYWKEYINTFDDYDPDKFIDYFKNRPTSEINWRECFGNRIPFHGMIFNVKYYYDEYLDLIEKYSYFKNKSLKDGDLNRYKIKNDEAFYFYMLNENKKNRLKMYQFYCYVYINDKKSVKDKLEKYGFEFKDELYNLVKHNIRCITYLSNTKNVVHIGEYRGKTKTLLKKKIKHKWEDKIVNYNRYGLGLLFDDPVMKKITKMMLKHHVLYNRDYVVFLKEFLHYAQ